MSLFFCVSGIKSGTNSCEPLQMASMIHKTSQEIGAVLVRSASDERKSPHFTSFLTSVLLNELRFTDVHCRLSRVDCTNPFCRSKTERRTAGNCFHRKMVDSRIATQLLALMYMRNLSQNCADASLWLIGML